MSRDHQVLFPEFRVRSRDLAQHVIAGDLAPLLPRRQRHLRLCGSQFFQPADGPLGRQEPRRVERQRQELLLQFLPGHRPFGQEDNCTSTQLKGIQPAVAAVQVQQHDAPPDLLAVEPSVLPVARVEQLALDALPRCGAGPHLVGPEALEGDLGFGMSDLGCRIAGFGLRILSVDLAGDLQPCVVLERSPRLEWQPVDFLQPEPAELAEHVLPQRDLTRVAEDAGLGMGRQELPEALGGSCASRTGQRGERHEQEGRAALDRVCEASVGQGTHRQSCGDSGSSCGDEVAAWQFAPPTANPAIIRLAVRGPRDDPR